VPACVRSIWYGGVCDVSGQEQDKKNEGGREGGDILALPNSSTLSILG